MTTLTVISIIALSLGVLFDAGAVLFLHKRMNLLQNQIDALARAQDRR